MNYRAPKAEVISFEANSVILISNLDPLLDSLAMGGSGTDDYE